jgi:hypothetical protein
MLTHYGSNTGLGFHMQLLMELMITEAGISPQPLSTPFHRSKGWVTHCWLKSLWEKVEKFLVRVEILELPLKFSREWDNWLIAVFENADYDEKALIHLNRVRCHQQALFISDVLGASGKTIDRRYLTWRQKGETWSTLIFPQERPPDKDFKLWESALFSIAPRGRLQDCIGKFVEKGHKIWDWRYDEEEAKLYHLKGAVMDIYTPSLVPGHARQANRWSRARLDQPRIDMGTIRTMQEVALGVKSIILFADGPLAQEKPTKFWEVLRRWQRTWMWENLQLIGDDHWIAEAIEYGTLIAVTGHI